ncbi:MAG: class I SAM-dependent methyltransferase [Solirubrobacterales bacterium]
MEARVAGDGGASWAEIAYEAIAPVYDDFTAHHDYELWLGELLKLAEAHGLRGRRLLDVGCGTGKSFIPMLAKGWTVAACDISPAMVALAREKVGEAAELAVADMRELPRFGAFDLVWCLDDAVNYLLEPAELERALSGMRGNLGPGGVLIFDVNLLQTYRGFFSEEVVLERDGRRLIWRGRGDPDLTPGSVVEASFEVEALEPGRAGIAPELHRQRHFPDAEIRAVVAGAGLQLLDSYGHGEDGIPAQPLDEAGHTKGIYVAAAAAGG